MSGCDWNKKRFSVYMGNTKNIITKCDECMNKNTKTCDECRGYPGSNFKMKITLNRIYQSYQSFIFRTLGKLLYELIDVLIILRYYFNVRRRKLMRMVLALTFYKKVYGELFKQRRG